MIRYTISRLLQAVVTVFIIVTLVFLLLRLLPNEYFFSEEELVKLTKEQRIERLKAEGLLDPIPTQLWRFYKDLAKGDFGKSRRIKAGAPVVTVIGSKFTVSMRLGLIALAVSLVLGVCFGAIQARFKNKIPDHIGTAFTVFINAVPKLVSYSLVLVLGATFLGLPSMYSVRNVTRSSILPIICLAMGSTANYMLWTRRYMVDEMNKDYIKLAKLKGLSNRSITFRHVLKNAFVPLAQYLPGAFLYTMGGSLLVERFFSVPGMGTLLTDAIARYDTAVVQIVVMFYAILGILGVFFGDLLMAVIDPRIRLTSDGGTR